MNQPATGTAYAQRMMSGIDEFIDRWRDEFYRTGLRCREAGPGFWMARAEIKRVDSGETVGGAQRSGETRERACDSLMRNFETNFHDLPRPPPEWGRVDLRMILIDYQAFNDKLTSALVHLQESRASGTLSESELHRIFWESRNLEIESTKILSKRMGNISEADRIALMTSPDGAYKNQTDPWNLDDMEQRSRLFQFIEDPSPEVVRAHEIHDARRVGS